MRSVLAALAVLAVAVGVASRCVPSDAATVGAVAISRATLDDDLSAISRSAIYSCVLTGSSTGTSGAGSAGAASANHGVFSASFAGRWLAVLVGDQLEADAVGRQELRVTPTARRWARAELVRQVTALLRQFPTCHGGTGTSVVQSLPGSFVTARVAALADTITLALWASGLRPTTAGLAGYYAGHAAAYNRECLTSIAYRTVGAQAEATATAAQITAGTLTIGAAASEARVTSSTPFAPQVFSACGNRLGTTATAVVNGRVGAVVGPLKGTGSYLVAEVTSSLPRSYVAARADVVTSLLQRGGAKVRRAVAAASRASPVTFDPRYGTYRADRVRPPTGPPAGAALTAGADTPD